MDTHEKRLAAYELALRAKYDADELKDLKAKGHTLPGTTSYPIDDEEDLDNAIHAVGRGGADHDTIRAYIMKRADAMGLSSKIPDNWNADGSLKEENAVETEDEGCPTCDGTGKIREGTTECPDCNGTGVKTEERSRSPRRQRKGARRRAVPLGPEVRHFSAKGLEVRSSSDGNQAIVRGSAIMYDTPYVVHDPWGEFEERMRAGCATNLLSRGVDCRLLLNHDGLAMARTVSGTLDLIDTAASLDMEARLDLRQHLANDFVIATERGDMSEMSVGMIVGRDEWGESEGRETRDVEELSDLLDVSGVTYAASPTTNLEMAQRMAAQMPIESRARLRRLEVAVRSGQLSPDEFAEMLAIMQGRPAQRAGKVLSKATADKLMGVTKTLHEVLGGAGFDPADLIDDEGDDDDSEGDAPVGDGAIGNNSESETTVPDGAGMRQIDPGEKMRAAPATPEERAEQSMSFGDQQSAVYMALMERFEDSNPWTGPCDLWVCDCADDWVVFESWGDPCGLWKIGYSLDGAVVTLSGEPVEVARETNYVPVARSATTTKLRLQMEARKRRLRAAA